MEAYLLDKYPPYGGAGSQIKSGVYLPGTAGNYISTPDSVLNSITGDIDIRVCVKLTDWTPAAPQDFVSKWVSPNRGPLFTMETGSTGKLQYAWSIDGTAATGVPISTVAVPFADGTVGWIRVTHDVDNGAGQNEVKFYTSIDGITWTQLGTTAIGAGVTSIFDAVAPLLLGSDGGSRFLNGTIYYAEVRNGIDGPIVAKFDSSQIQVSGAQSPATINGWTWNGSALYKCDDYVRLPGTAGNYLSFPDTPANSVTGDIDIRAKVSADDWTPAGNQRILNKELVGQRSYSLGIGPAGVVLLRFSSNGTTVTGDVPSSTGNTFVDGSTHWVRATRNVAGQCNFYTSEDGTTWLPLGTANVASSPGLIFDSTAIVEIGSRIAGTAELFAGSVYYAEVRNGINGPVVASFNAADFADVQTPWAINGAGWSWEGSSFTGKPVTVLSLPGTTGNGVTTPDTAGNSITGDIDIRAKLSMDDWTPVARSTFAMKYASGGNNRSWRFLSNLGPIEFGASPDGTSAALVSALSTVNPPFADGAIGWVRATWRQSDGRVQFFTGTDGSTWAPLGTDRSLVIANLFDGTASIDIGGSSNEPLAGKIYYAEVRNGIDGPIVAKFDATAIAKTGTRLPTTLTQMAGITPVPWTISGSAWDWVNVAA